MPTATHLQKELETYEKHRAELVGKSDGKYVVIHGTQIFGTWDTFEDALKEGYAKCGLDKPFLVKQISVIDQVHYVTRVPCQP